MVSIKKVYDSDFDKIYPLLQGFQDSLPELSWRMLIQNTWKQPEGYCGFGLFDDDKLVGFLGTLFSDRLIEGRVEKFCNLTSWIIKEDYRDHAVFMLFSILRKLKDYTITDLSASDAVLKISERLGFLELDLKFKLLIPYISLYGIFRKRDFACVDEIDTINSILSKSDLQIFHDHKPFPCKHLVIANSFDKTRYCYIVYSKIDGYRSSHCHLHYVSDWEVFSSFSSMIRLELWRREKTPFIIIDSRLTKNVSLPLCFTLPRESTRLYKPSGDIKPQDIDNLYSELLILNLRIVPPQNGFLSSILKSLSRKRAN